MFFFFAPISTLIIAEERAFFSSFEQNVSGLLLYNFAF